MSKKYDSKSVIPEKMKGSVFSSLSDLGTALGFKAPEQPDPKAKKCRKCGSVMQQLPGTNVWLCPGTTDEGKPCGNRIYGSTGRSSAYKPVLTAANAVADS